MGFCQDIPIQLLEEEVIIQNDSSFVRNISVHFKKNSEDFVYPIFYDRELEEVENLRVEIKKGKKYKAFKHQAIASKDIDTEYITSKRIKSIAVPAEENAKVSYSIHCKELMYFTDLRLFSFHDVDSIKYKITVPKSLHMARNLIYQDSIKFLQVDSVLLDTAIQWKIKAVPIKIKADPLALFGIYRNLKVPLFRTIITPTEYIGNETAYMNHWYLNKLEKRIGLDSLALRKIDLLTEGMTDSLQIIKSLYKYVRSNFKYVAIEIGMGAFIPSHVNEVYRHKYGDCKDLSNFLSEALRHKGIRSDIALAATFNHISNCDFPSLVSANHVICVAYCNGKKIILDPTDPIHIMEQPVQSLQNRSILIINKDGGEFLSVEGFSPRQNLIDYQIKLQVNSDQNAIEGDFHVSYNGLSGNYLKYSLYDQNKDKRNKICTKYYESVFNQENIGELKLSDSQDPLQAQGKISVKGKLFKDKHNSLLFLDFLPRLVESVERKMLLEGTYLGHTCHKRVKIQIQLPDEYKEFEPIKHEITKENVSLHMRIEKHENGLLECNYDFVLNHIFIDKHNKEAINHILKSFKEITNEPIILQKKG
ncbi:transglutaminase-like domain-containing protein [Marinifilum caeruleilacunae]|uniref:Transglutaminase domain-containing protein n=1 Tax=Marinifilum caeruleilacunae TaxID=2499076 RepID=A0ABX1WR10_9BACT|nr:transglutaminase-like domain-containing protein [Marinifilum caeruleilacunae]NOU58528.1 transglutaminase domain-containing protein [Marinifilum caeruleilacunae]